MKTTGRPGIIPKLRCRWKLSLRIVRIKTSPIHGWTVSRERSTRHWRRRLRRLVDRLMILLSNHIHQPPHRNTNNECLVLSYSCPSLPRPSFEDSVESGLYIFCSIKWIKDRNGHRWSSFLSPSIATDRLANDANVISEGGDPWPARWQNR